MNLTSEQIFRFFKRYPNTSLIFNRLVVGAEVVDCINKLFLSVYHYEIMCIRVCISDKGTMEDIGYSSRANFYDGSFTTHYKKHFVTLKDLESINIMPKSFKSI